MQTKIFVDRICRSITNLYSTNRFHLKNTSIFLWQNQFLYTCHITISTLCCNFVPLVSFAHVILVIIYIFSYLIYITICLFTYVFLFIYLFVLVINLFNLHWLILLILLFQFIYLFVYILMYFIYLFIHLCIHFFINLFHLFTNLTYMSVCLLIYISVC